MADFEKLQENVDPIMKSVVKNILKNRGVTSDKVRTLSEEEKENIFNMLEDLKKQTDALVQKQKEKAAAPNEKGTKREKNADASSENGERPRKTSTTEGARKHSNSGKFNRVRYFSRKKWGFVVGYLSYTS